MFLRTRSSSNSDSVLLNPPKAETKIEAYTKERLEFGLHYVTTKLKRDLTPRTEDFLSIHKDTYQASLEPYQSVGDREGCLREVQTFDKIYCSHAFLYRTIPTQEMEGLEAIRKVREYEVLARYGDYLGQEVQDTRTNVYAERTNEEEEEETRSVRPKFSNEKLWTEIADIMKVEQEEINDWKLRPGGADSLERNVRWALKKACATLGIDNDHMHWSIQQYAARNRTFHSNINTHIARCQWWALAKHIHTDLGDLPLVMGLKEAAPFEQSLRNIRNQYFKLPCLDDPDTWLPSEYACQLTNEKVEKEIQRQEKLKRRIASEETKPEESMAAKRKEKRPKVVPMALKKDEELTRLKMVALSIEEASTQTNGIDSPSTLF